jgi:hypothetical protein
MIYSYRVLAFVLGCAITAPASAQMRGWDRQSDPFRGNAVQSAPRGRADDVREGRVEVARFLAASVTAETFGHGGIGLVTLPGSISEERDRATFEAAVLNQLILAGYDSTAPAESLRHLVELRIVDEVAESEEPPRKPVSGQMGVEFGTRGTSTSLAVNVDLSKPKNPLISHRLEVRIKDGATGELLWEGRATLLARDGDRHWTTQVIAESLAAALFATFEARG